MNSARYVIRLTLSVFLIIGVYQFYFWCQRHQWATPREWLTSPPAEPWAGSPFGPFSL